MESKSTINIVPPSKYEEMTVVEWLVTMLILIIPFVNIIMLFIWAFGAEDRRENFAKANLIWMAIWVGISLVITLFIVIISIAFYNSY